MRRCAHSSTFCARASPNPRKGASSTRTRHPSSSVSRRPRGSPSPLTASPAKGARRARESTREPRACSAAAHGRWSSIAISRAGWVGVTGKGRVARGLPRRRGLGVLEGRAPAASCSMSTVAQPANLQMHATHVSTCQGPSTRLQRGKQPTPEVTAPRAGAQRAIRPPPHHAGARLRAPLGELTALPKPNRLMRDGNPRIA